MHAGTGVVVDDRLKRWPALSRYADSGDLPIDKICWKNAIRPITLGRRKWLFTGSERAACRAVAIQRLLATTLNGLEPRLPGSSKRWKTPGLARL